MSGANIAAATVQSSLQPAGPAARMTTEMTWVLTTGAAAVFVVVMLCLAFALRRRRTLAGDAADRGVRWWLLGAGLAFPVAVLVPLLLYAAARSDAMTAPGTGTRAGDLVITVEARLWWWRVTYRDPLLGREVVSANQINLPTGRGVTLALVSNDVIHSFWVPPLAGKVDMVPGRLQHLRLQVDRPGLYRGQCAEFCGEQHARMAIHVLAQPPEEFARWLQAQAEPAALPPDPVAQRGLAVFRERRCGACHNVAGLGTNLAVGPGPRPNLATGPRAAPSATIGSRPGTMATSGPGLGPMAATGSGPGQSAITGPGPGQNVITGPGPGPWATAGPGPGQNVTTGPGPGPGPVATIGPDLTHLASRLHLGAGTLPFSREALAGWIADPQHAKPGVRMPAYPLDAGSMQALVGFLEQLR